MRGRIEGVVGRVTAGWVEAASRRPLPLLLAIVAATVAVATYTAGHLGVNADVNQMFSEEVHYRALEIEYNRTFPALSENILVVIDAETSVRARDAAAALAERMRAAPDLFQAVFLPQGAFFEEHALLYMDVEELQDFADRMARVQPYLAGLARDGTLRGLAELMGRGAEAVREGDVEGDELRPMLERFAVTVDARVRGERAELSWAEVVAGRDLDVDDRRRVILTRPVLDMSDFVAARTPLETLRRYVRELELEEPNGVRVRITGDVALSYEEMQGVQSQAAVAGVISFFLVGALLYAALRSLRLLLATLVTLVLGLIWTAGFAAAAIGHLNVISVAFAVLFIGLSVDFGLHFCMRYQELVGSGETRDRALVESGRTVGGSIALCALTTAIGFYAFVPTDFEGVAELGLIAGTGMFVSLAGTLTVLPALISLRSAAPSTRSSAMPRWHFLPSFPSRHPRAVTAAAVLLGLASLALMPGVYFDADPVALRDPSAESVKTFEDLVAARGESPLDISVVAVDLDVADALAGRLRELDAVKRAITVADFVPTDQERKLEIIEDVALFLAPPPGADGSPSRPELHEQVAALRELASDLARLDAATHGIELAAAAADARASIDVVLGRVDSGADVGSLVGDIEQGLLASLPGQLRTLDLLVNAGPITLESLPRSLLDRMVSHDGSVRVRVFPAEDLSDTAALARFVTAIRAVAPDATGSAVNVYEASREAVRALRQALGAAVVVIALLLFLIWRTVGDTAMVMAPLALAGLLTAAAGVLVGIPFNFADIIVLPLLLGIGVDSGIHLVERSRQEGATADHLLETSTAHAVLFSSLTTIASFGTLAIASHRGMASMGQLLAIGVGLAVVANLVLLPALLELRLRHSYHPRSGSPAGLGSARARGRMESRSLSRGDR